MLVRKTKEGESLWIGDLIEIRVIRTGRQITLGVIAPKEMKIAAQRIPRAIAENTRAALSVPTLCELDAQIGTGVPLIIQSVFPPKSSVKEPIIPDQEIR